MNAPSRHSGGKKIIIIFFIFCLFFSASILFILFIPMASINIIPTTEPITTRFSITLDETLKAPLPAIPAIPARLIQDINELKNRTAIGDIKFTNSDTNDIIKYNQSEMEEIAVQKLNDILRPGWNVMSVSNISIIIQDVERTGGKVAARAEARVEGLAIPIYPYEQWLNSREFDPSKFRDIIMSASVKDARIAIWPPFWPYLPVISQRIKFSLDI